MQRTNGPIRPLCRATHLLLPRPARLAAAPSHDILRFRSAEHADEKPPRCKTPRKAEKCPQKSGDGAMLFASPSPLDLGISGRGRKK